MIKKLLGIILMLLFSTSLYAANFYWKDTFAGLDALTDSNGDRGVVLDSSGVMSFYTNDGTGWTKVYVTGRMQVVEKSTAYTLGADNDNEPYRGQVFITGTMTLTLPAVAVGMNFCVTAIGAVTVTIDPNANDGIRLNGSTRATDGNYIISGGAAGETICLIGDSAAGWTAIGDSTWTAQ